MQHQVYWKHVSKTQQYEVTLEKFISIFAIYAIFAGNYGGMNSVREIIGFCLPI